ncbi:carbohydrate porin [Sphingomonas sp. Leaf22]|uniref:carbohydrate porin n=1 Tax=Sphingomonas sp. Leaf22 TaxID=1735687 RepID=UPI001F239B48|nr:carbohydrate porin [Sphingomonas sp. Leaf22]
MDDRFDAGTDAATVRHVRSDGLYVRGEVQLAGNRDRGLRSFVRFGTASGRANLFGRFASSGFVWHGLLPGRPADDSGFAVAYAGAGSASRDLTLARYGRAVHGETTIEVTHRIAVTDWLGVQPHVQYVLDPGLDPTVDDALVLGLRLTGTVAR